MDRKTKGRLAEAAVIKEMILLGYEVYTPFSDCAKYDLLARQGTEILRVTVKYCSTQTDSGGYLVELRQVSRRNNSTVQVDKFDPADFDILAVYIGPEDRVVLKKVDFSNTRGITI